MWSALPGGESPTTRGKHSATLVGRYIYVLGGRGGNVPLRDLWRYHIERNAWERIKSSGDTPPCLQEHTAVARGDRLYVFGGEVAINITETPLWVLDTTNHKWRKLTGNPSKARAHGAQASPRGRRGHTAHILGDMMLLYGGYMDLKGSTNELWAYHFDREIWQLLNASGPSRHRHAASLHDRKLYVYGGMHDLTEKGETHMFDIMARKWRTIRCKVSPGPLSGSASSRVGARMFVVGGESDGQLTDSMWAFHFATETWESIWSGRGGPTPRADGVAIALSRDMLPTRNSIPRSHRPVEHIVNTQDETVPTFLQEIGSNLARLTARPRSKAARCSYTALTPDSNESIPSVPLSTIIKSRSIHGGVARDVSPKEGDTPTNGQDSHLPLSKLVHLDSDDDEEQFRQEVSLPKSASVRFSTLQANNEHQTKLPTELGFANPNYMTASEAARQLSTPDSGVESGSGAHVEMRDMRTNVEMRAKSEDRKDVRARKSLGHVLLLIGGRERPHALHLARPLAMWCRDV